MGHKLPAARRITGSWWRHIPADGNPLFRPDTPSDGRWQPGAAVDALYLADEPETMWAEWYRFLAEVGIPPDRLLPRDVWRFDIDLSAVADLSSPAKLRAVGLDVPRPGRSTWPLYQQRGDWLHHNGFEGVLAPSAARPGHLVPCVFRGAGDPIGVTPTGPAQRQRSAPTPPTGMTT